MRRRSPSNQTSHLKAKFVMAAVKIENTLLCAFKNET